LEKEDPKLNEAVQVIERQMHKVTEDTENDFQRRRMISNSICWLVILLLVGNYFFHWLF